MLILLSILLFFKLIEFILKDFLLFLDGLVDLIKSSILFR